MRGKQAVKRTVDPDPQFKSTVIARLVNMIMRNGKKSTAQDVVYGALKLISEKTKQDPLDVFELALKNVSPVVEVRSRRIGGANYQVPVEVRASRRMTLGLRWMIDAARSRKGGKMKERLALELMDASKLQGSAVKKKEDVQRMADANRAFAHFA